MTFGQKIYNLRTSRNLSQIEFARMIESSQSAITAWENNTRIPPLKTIQKFKLLANQHVFSQILLIQGSERFLFIIESLKNHPQSYRISFHSHHYTHHHQSCFAH